VRDQKSGRHEHACVERKSSPETGQREKSKSAGEGCCASGEMGKKKAKSPESGAKKRSGQSRGVNDPSAGMRDIKG